MSSQLVVPCRVAARALGVALLLAGGVWLTTDLPARDPAQAPPPRKRQPEEEEDPATKAPPPKSGRAEDEDTTPPKATNGKKKRMEEEEDTARTPHKVIQVDDDDAPARPLTTRQATDLAVLARRTKNRRVAALYKRLAVPYDLFLKTGQLSTEERVMPLATYIADDPQGYFKRGGERVTPLDANGKPGTSHNVVATTIRSFKHYEQIVLSEVDDFLNLESRNPRSELSHDQQLAVAEALLTAAVRFHESARAIGQRKGDEWHEAVEIPLRNRLLDIRLEQLKALTESNQWDAAFDLTVLLAGEFRGADEQQRIAKPLTDLLQASLRSGVESEEGTRQALRRLRDLEVQFPDKKVLEPLKSSLTRHAEALGKQAKAAAEEKRFDKALELIGQAVELDPENTTLRTYQRNLMQQHRILRVGVRSLPEFMSPSLAATDSEIRAVELMFESLVKFGVDPYGNARFIPGLAAGPPQVDSLSRRFTLPNATWSNAQPLTANDIRRTVALLKEHKGERVFGPAASLLDGVRGGPNPYLVNLQMIQGYIEPPALMAFKIVPELPSNQPDADTKEFAKNPISSGPYQFARDTSSDVGRPCVSFIYNPLYGSRQGKEGLPHIREIRFLLYKAYDGKGNPTEDFDRPAGSAPLDMILDLPPEHAVAIAKKQGLAHVHIRRPGVNEAPNRRIYLLAINCSIPPFDGEYGPKIRRALAHAINREKLLTECFRQKEDPDTSSIIGHLHAALNGPYPPGSWACNPKVGEPKVKGSLDLFDAQLAAPLLKNSLDKVPGKGIRGTPYKLKYPDDDPAVKEAMEGICKQFADVGFKVEAVPVDPHKLRSELDMGDFELAYCHYDFQDETYSLVPLMDFRDRQDGTGNFFHCSDLGKVEAALQNVRAYREFSKVKQDTRDIHEELYNVMPFIPLWQLDPLAAVHDSVDTPWFDPILVFSEIERWKAGPR